LNNTLRDKILRHKGVMDSSIKNSFLSEIDLNLINYLLILIVELSCLSTNCENHEFNYKHGTKFKQAIHFNNR